jgi:ABC-type amino acid transport substrate-binding protein
MPRCLKSGSFDFAWVPCLALLCLLSMDLTGAAGAETVRVGVTPGAFEVLASRLGLGNEDPVQMSRDDCPTLRSGKLKDAGRTLVEPIIVCNAVFGANLADRIELIHHLPHRRRLNEIAAGRIDVSGSTIFPEAADTLSAATRPLLSDAVIRVNEFEKGIFTLSGRDDVLAVRSLEELRKFKAVIVKFWVVDMKTLDAMNLKGIARVSKPDLYIKFLKAGRADFTISEFSSMTSHRWAKEMARVPGVKISLISPRVIPVSPLRDDIMRAINGFLEKSRSGEEDLVERAFREAGFFRSEFSDWELLFPVNRSGVNNPG